MQLIDRDFTDPINQVTPSSPKDMAAHLQVIRGVLQHLAHSSRANTHQRSNFSPLLTPQPERSP